MKSSFIKYFSFLFVVCILVTSCSEEDEPTTTGSTGPQTIYRMAVEDPELSLIAEAISKTNLTSSFNTGSNLTAFLPTNSVFSAYLADLGYSNIDAWLTVADEEVVKQMLLYHLLGSEFLMADLATGYIKTLSNNADNFPMDIFINSASGVLINGLNTGIIEGDIEASNGTIHKINGVLQPQNIGNLLSNNPDFSELIATASLAQGDIIATLSTPNTSYTMMAPNNGAFNQFYSSRTDIANVGDMVTVFGVDVLQDIMDFHIILGSVRSGEFATQSYNTRLAGASQSLNTSGGNLSITDGQGRQAFFFFKDITASNGTVHIISNVLLAP